MSCLFTTCSFRTMCQKQQINNEEAMFMTSRIGFYCSESVHNGPLVEVERDTI